MASPGMRVFPGDNMHNGHRDIDIYRSVPIFSNLIQDIVVIDIKQSQNQWSCLQAEETARASLRSTAHESEIIEL